MQKNNLRMFTRENTTLDKTQTLTTSINMDICVIGSTNQLFIGGS